MQKISSTFCPAKWDELVINFENNFAYACCKATPTEISDNVLTVLSDQKNNLLNNVQDTSCNYCWDLEKTGLQSQRHYHLNKFNKEDYEKYTQNKLPDEIEINLGNICNFQCIYCNPKFSSKWAADVTNKPYNVFNDKFNYSIPIKSETTVNTKLELLKNYYSAANKLRLVGGEPFYSKHFFYILEQVSCKELIITTNLSCSIEQIDRFFLLAKKFNKVFLNVSIDATGKIAEFNRYGLNFTNFVDNLKYIIKNRPDNLGIGFQSLLTSLTIVDLSNFIKFMQPYIQLDNCKWELSYCKHPEFQSFKTLRDTDRETAINLLKTLENNSKINHVNVIISALTSTKFNKTLYKQLEIFVKEFATRKNIEIPY